MISMSVLLTLAMPATVQAVPPASQQQRAAIPLTAVDVELLVRSCDRLVLARLGQVREFDRKPGSLGKAAPPKIRIASLEIISAPFGSMAEKLHVRLPEGATPPELGVWPLGRNLLAADDDWNAFRRIEKNLLADPLWTLSSNNDPWPIRTTANAQEVLVPGLMLGTRSATHSTPSARFASRWIRMDDLQAAIAVELTRISPRTEAAIVGMVPIGWDVEIQGDGHGTFDTSTAFAWTEDQRGRWEQAIEKFEFASMPSQVGSSSTPCSSVLVLSRVTAAGRRTVRYFGDGPRDGSPDPWVSRFQGLWGELRALTPNQGR